MTSAMILGATGQVGQALLQVALASPVISRIVAPTRRALPEQERLVNPIVDFEQLPENADWWHADIVYCALGTTLRQARSKERFYRVDHDYILASADLALKAGTPAFGLVSALGADPSSSLFYNRVKGLTEKDLSALGFQSLTVVRPSLLIGGPRARARPLESLGLFIGKHLSALLPRHYRAVSVQAVAQTLFTAGLRAEYGLNIIESENISI